jgi:hypothetical protein
MSIEQLLVRLEKMHYCGAIIGPDGSGKTTLLEDLGTALARRGFDVISVFINDTTPLTEQRYGELLHSAGANSIILIDGADHLQAGVWRRLKCNVLSTARGLVITSHKPGMLETLTECRTDLPLFEQIVAELMPGGGLEAARLAGIFARHGGNIRDALRELYDILSRRD